MSTFSRREFIKRGVAGAALAGVAMPHLFAGNPRGDGDQKPNILLIMTDQQCADALSCAGNPWVKTPAMDSIAERGVRFTKAYANLPVCMPQRYTWFTGRLPCTRRDADNHPKPIISTGNMAKAAGYSTYYTGKWHIQDQTFDRDDVKHHGFDINVGAKDETIATNAVEFFANYNKQEPFFACRSFYNPHDICEWGRKKSGRTEGIKMRNGEVIVDPPLDECPPLPDNFAINPDESEAVGVRREIGGAQAMAMEWDEDTWRQYLWAYYRLVEIVDKRVGEVLAGLEKSGQLDNTIIIFTSDHGEGIAGHRWHQKSILYEESVHVPFIVCDPRSPRRGEVDERLVSSGIDVMATIADICGQPMPAGPYYGKSVMPFVMNADSKAERHAYVVSEADVGKDYAGRAIRTERFKYHAWNKGENREQFFDLVADPGETTNLIGDPSFATELAQHREHLADWLRRTDDSFAVLEA